MCLQAVWESAVAAGEAHYPPTYEAGDHYTHATGVPTFPRVGEAAPELDTWTWVSGFREGVSELVRTDSLGYG